MKRIITATAMAFAAIAGTLVVAAPASASGSCNQTFKVTEAKYGTLVAVPALSQSVAGTDCVMSVGSYGSAVKNLQGHLNACYGPGGDVHTTFGTNLSLDSDFGTNTKNALKSVQSWLGLTVDGVYGKNTRNTMEFWLGGDCAELWPI